MWTNGQCHNVISAKKKKIKIRPIIWSHTKYDRVYFVHFETRPP